MSDGHYLSFWELLQPAVPRQLAIRVDIGRYDSLIIRQECPGSDDTCIVVQVQNVRRLVDVLLRECRWHDKAMRRASKCQARRRRS
jgi:hypothetical protein